MANASTGRRHACKRMDVSWPWPWAAGLRALLPATLLLCACSPAREVPGKSSATLDIAADQATVAGPDGEDGAIQGPADVGPADAATATLGVCKDMVCQDNNPCTLDQCDPVKGCEFVPAPNTEHCGYLNQGVCNAGTCAASGCSSMAGLQMGAAWPTEGACPSHQSRSPYLGPQTNALKWTFTDPDLWGIANDFWRAPIIDRDGTVYITNKEWVFAVLANGTLKWKSSIGGLMARHNSPVVAASGNIYVTAGNGRLTALDPQGVHLWSIETGCCTHAGPSIGPDGTIYYTRHGGGLYAVSPSGVPLWQLDFACCLFSSLSIGEDGTIYLASKDWHVYAISPAGTILWKHMVGGPVLAPPIVAPAQEGRIFLAVNPSVKNVLGRVIALGRDPWEFAPSNDPKVLNWDGLAHGADGTVYVSNRCVQAIDGDGKLKWVFADDLGTVGGYSCTPPAIGGDGTIYVAQATPRCHPNPIKGGDECHNDLYALNPDGTEKWHWKTPNVPFSPKLSPPVIGQNGTLYVTWLSGALFAFGQ